jgi:hypothetical protein
MLWLHDGDLLSPSLEEEIDGLAHQPSSAGALHIREVIQCSELASPNM